MHEAAMRQIRGRGARVLVLVVTIAGGARVSLAGIEACEHPEFAAARAFTSQTNPFAVAAGDFDGDTLLDAASVSFTNGDVAVSLGNGDGTFQPAVEYPDVLANADILVVSDLDGDEHPDLVVGSRFGSAAILPNVGDGTFDTVIPLTGSPGYGIAVGNLNADAIPDIVFADGTVRLGNGDFTFADPVGNPTGGGGTSVVIGDVGRPGTPGLDGVPDVVIGTTGALGYVVTLLGNGDGTFQTAVSSLATSNNDAVAIGDFDRDGLNDVAVLNSANGSFNIYLGSGDGTFHIREFHTTGNVGPIISALYAIDLDGDENLDLVAGSFQTFVLRGNGDGTFQAPVRYYQMATGLALGDFDEDGEVDVLGGKAGLDANPSVALLLGNGDGTLREAPGYPVGDGPHAPQVGDLNGDGRSDIVVPDAFGNTVSVLVNAGDGTFLPKVDYAAGQVPVSVALARFDADSDLDLVVANQNSPDILFYAGNGDGTFQPPTVAGSMLLGSFAVVAGRFDGDGNMDFAASGLSPSAQQGIMVFSGNGDGTFKSPGPPAGTAFLLDTMAAGDFDRDGRRDIAYTKFGTNTVGVILGNGSGGFAANVDYTVGTNVQAVTVGDLSGDGVLDVVTANHGCLPCTDPDLNFNGSVSVLVGNGDGTFQPHHTQVVNQKGTMHGVAAADLNGDGDVDVAVTDSLLNVISVLLGNGDGTLQAAFHFAVQILPTQPAVGDVDGNGSPDLVVANQAVDTVSVLRNTCPAVANPACTAPSECDDDDPCTENLCDDGYCVFVDVPNVIACVVDEGLQPVACATAKVPGGFRKKLGKAAKAVDVLLSGSVSEKKLARARKKVDTGLAGARKAVDKAEGRRKKPLAAECATALREIVSRAEASVPD